MKHNKQTLNIPEFIRGKIKKKLRESPTREFIVSELMAHTGSPCYNARKLYSNLNFDPFPLGNNIVVNEMLLLSDLKQRGSNRKKLLKKNHMQYITNQKAFRQPCFIKGFILQYCQVKLEQITLYCTARKSKIEILISC